MEEHRFNPIVIAEAATEALIANGLQSSMAAAVAEVLIDAEIMGHHTHGLGLLPHYLNQLGDGGMAKSGEITVLRDANSAFFWQANRLPGAWVLKQAIAEMVKRAGSHPVVTASLAECFHIGSLQTYLQAATRHGLICTIATTDPSVVSVAPFGGLDPVLTSNPIAYGIPTSDEPILIDLCTSVVSNSAVQNYRQAGRRLPGKWLLDNQGETTDDPQALQASPPGTIMPLGGTEFGYKGFALGLVVEALALGLSGYDRGSERRSFGEGVFLQIINPEFFAGRAALEAEMTRLAEHCRSSRVPDGADPVRLPGQRAQERARTAERDGIAIADDIRALLGPWLPTTASAD